MPYKYITFSCAQYEFHSVCHRHKASHWRVPSLYKHLMNVSKITWSEISDIALFNVEFNTFNNEISRRRVANPKLNLHKLLK